MNILLWIQGPLYLDILNENLKILEKHKETIKIVVCTNTIVSEYNANFELIYVPDPGEDKNEKIVLNYSRQFSTTNRILFYERINDFDFILKIRSDFKIYNLTKFESLLKKLLKNPDAIIVSQFSTFHNDNALKYKLHISDWFYFGKVENIINFIAQSNRRCNVLKVYENRIYFSHWVGLETCEQAMINKRYFQNIDFYRAIIPINPLKYGLILEKYKKIFKPTNWYEFKSYIFFVLCNYTETDYNLLRLNKNIFKIIKYIKFIIIKLYIYRK